MPPRFLNAAQRKIAFSTLRYNTSDLQPLITMSTTTATATPAPAPAVKAGPTANGTSNGVHKPAPILTAEQKKKWSDTGCLAISARDMWTPQELSALIEGVNLMDSWPDKAGHWMKVRNLRTLRTACIASAHHHHTLLCICILFG